ncbi:hypothetical protein PILCRDRAFT_1983 [Piloderma croceum F 1598]|uniref:Uncharacterized protein n=1 Tax=Piloderma croceum (strain F 1598) TaxID=765440 RepID=A0A0C3BT13_PILCF|nr:hypothetical protein PILCRDRAFT_1983 [Piloderma croceum F 1598]
MVVHSPSPIPPKFVRYSYQKKLVTAYYTEDFDISKKNALEGRYHVLHVVCGLTQMTHEPPAFERAARIKLPPSGDVTLYRITGSLWQMEFIGADTWEEVQKEFDKKTIIYLRDSSSWSKRLAKKIRHRFTSPKGTGPSEQPKQKASENSVTS